jgi:hypothetical protein
MDEKNFLIEHYERMINFNINQLSRKIPMYWNYYF